MSGLLNIYLYCFYTFQLDRDGLHDLNIQAEWQFKGGTYWVRYIHVEIIGFPSAAATGMCSLNVMNVEIRKKRCIEYMKLLT